jgi:hypothetical protein
VQTNCNSTSAELTRLGTRSSGLHPRPEWGQKLLCAQGLVYTGGNRRGTHDKNNVYGPPPSPHRLSQHTEDAEMCAPAVDLTRVSSTTILNMRGVNGGVNSMRAPAAGWSASHPPPSGSRSRARSSAAAPPRGRWWRCPRRRSPAAPRAAPSPPAGARRGPPPGAPAGSGKQLETVAQQATSRSPACCTFTSSLRPSRPTAQCTCGVGGGSRMGDGVGKMKGRHQQEHARRVPPPAPPCAPAGEEGGSRVQGVVQPWSPPVHCVHSNVYHKKLGHKRQMMRWLE